MFSGDRRLQETSGRIANANSTLEDRRRLRDRFAVVPRLRSGIVHAGAVAHHRLPVAKDAAAWRDHRDLVPERGELAAHLRGHERLDVHVTTFERQLVET